jgi:23S rRNA pseudouridine2605 synthase
MDRVQKLLSSYGYCSRRKAEDLIRQGRVTVNDRIISIGDKASHKDKILVDGNLVGKDKKVYLMLNKPVGCVTALKDKNYKVVTDYVQIKERVFPVGRLDYNTSGLLLLTNDGDFANRVMHPRYEIKKTYLVSLYSPAPEDKVNAIKNGVMLDDRKTWPAHVNKINDNLLEITIHEGRNRIIRKMMKKLGLKVQYLERTKIGSLKLGNLGPGKFRHLLRKDIDKIFK